MDITSPPQADIVDDVDDHFKVQKSPIMAAADAVVGEDLAIHASCNRPARPLP